MQIKDLLTKITSTKFILVAALSAATVVNELRLKVAVHEIEKSNEEKIQRIADSFAEQSLAQYNAYQQTLIDLADELSYQSGLVPDYDLIAKNTEIAVGRGFKQALAHQMMQMREQKQLFETFVLQYMDGSMSLMKVTEREDTIPLIQEHMKIK